MLTELEQKIIAEIQGDIPIAERPFLEIAKKIGISEESLLDTLGRLNNKGMIRRFGATLRHQKSGFEANAMVAWQVEEDRIDAVGRLMSSSGRVSHCYRRNPTPEWEYNLYTMIHAKDEQSCMEIAKNLAEKAGMNKYALLFSRKELKKTSMQYFPNDAE